MLHRLALTRDAVAAPGWLPFAAATLLPEGILRRPTGTTVAGPPVTVPEPLCGVIDPVDSAVDVVRRAALRQIGRVERFADVLADDHPLGQSIRAVTCTVSVGRPVVEHFCEETSLPGLWQHELRWTRTLRRLDPPGFAGAVGAGWAR